MDINSLCQKCQERPGKPWDGSGGFTCLCGPCKLNVVLGGDRGKKFGVDMSAELSAVTGTSITVKVDVPDDLKAN